MYLCNDKINPIESAYTLQRKALAEFTGTFFLVLVGVGSIHINDITDNSITGIGIAFVFGGVVALMVSLFGPVSGAHINPAVSIGFFVKRQLSLKELMIYTFSQITGAIMAAVLIYVNFESSICLGCTVPLNISIGFAFLLEWIATLTLMLVILIVIRKSFSAMISGLCIGAVIMLFSIIIGAYTGASLNPARSIAPSIVFGELRYIWLYIFAPLTGSISAVILWKWIK